jgi:mRNA interferase HigB
MTLCHNAIVNVIAPKTLRAFWELHPNAEEPMREWLKLMQKTNFEHFADLKTTFGSADWTSPYVIFDVGGNKYRIVVAIHFPTQVAFIKAVLTHLEYDNWNKRRRP